MEKEGVLIGGPRRSTRKKARAKMSARGKRGRGAVCGLLGHERAAVGEVERGRDWAGARWDTGRERELGREDWNGHGRRSRPSWLWWPKIKEEKMKSFSIFQTNFPTTFECKFKSS